jgi:uncharacterized protein (TIGR02246 family)
MNSSMEEALEAVQHDWNAAARNWDVDALTALYSEDAVFFGGRPGQSVGHEAVRGYFASYVGVLASTSLELFDQQQVPLGPDVLLAQGYCRFGFLLVDGRRTSAVMRMTWVLQEGGGQWKIRQHHFSTTPEAPPIE